MYPTQPTRNNAMGKRTNKPRNKMKKLTALFLLLTIIFCSCAPKNYCHTYDSHTYKQKRK
jgi:hypothetical protein